MGKAVDLTNKRFGRLTAIELCSERKNGERQWLCKCDCGSYCKVITGNLNSGSTRSCGCLLKESGIKNATLLNKKPGRNKDKKKYNNFIVHPEYVEIIMKRCNAIIDNCDIDLVKQYCWNLNGSYACTSITVSPNHQKKLLLHRLIIGEIPKGMQVDHINRNKLDNRRENLRIVTPSQNSSNIGKPKTNTSGYKWVSYDKSKRKFLGSFSYNKIWHKVGLFDSAVDAYNAVIEERQKIMGEEHIYGISYIE